MAECKNLELIRLAANKLTELPDWLFELPKLAWLAFSGNSLAQQIDQGTENNAEQKVKKETHVPAINSNDYSLKQQLGQGASGVIYQASWHNTPSQLETDNDIAVKIFKGAITSDGYPIDELNNCLQAGEHSNLIKVLAKIMHSDELALIMELIPTNFANLGLPPSLASCTRDTFTDDTQFTLSGISCILNQLTDTMAHLHKNKVSHGDLYAHNTMINEHSDVLFGDVGAASNLNILTKKQQQLMEKIEVRALGYLLGDLLIHFEKNNVSDNALQSELYHLLEKIKEKCLRLNLNNRATFDEVKCLINSIF
jgi:serine/threonine protein kinase